MDTLPEDCIISILFYATPRDICQFLATSSRARDIAESDTLWEKFLPSDYDEILSRLVSPIQFKSKKDLFMRLLSPLHIDKGSKLLWLDRFTGKKCYLLSARELFITWGDNPMSWSWKPLLQSRFSEIVELVTTWWLEITAKVNSRMLSPNTMYVLYLIINFSNHAYGLDTVISEVTIKLGHRQLSRATIYLRPKRKKSLWGHLGLVSMLSLPQARDYVEENKGVHKRVDGWFEIKLGEFYNYGNDEVVKMSLKETEGVHLKGGLIVEGIEIRPKK